MCFDCPASLGGVSGHSELRFQQDRVDTEDHSSDVKTSECGGSEVRKKPLLLVAVGGPKMVQAIGKADRNGGEATTQHYLPQHLFATILQKPSLMLATPAPTATYPPTSPA
jgi:hypothetical protein